MENVRGQGRSEEKRGRGGIFIRSSRVESAKQTRRVYRIQQTFLRRSGCLRSMRYTRSVQRLSQCVYELEISQPLETSHLIKTCQLDRFSSVKQSRTLDYSIGARPLRDARREACGKYTPKLNLAVLWKNKQHGRRNSESVDNLNVNCKFQSDFQLGSTPEGKERKYLNTKRVRICPIILSINLNYPKVSG